MIDRAHNKSLLRKTQKNQQNIPMEMLSEEFQPVAFKEYVFEDQ